MEEVIDGKSERGGHEVIQVPMTQWMLKITKYAEQLLEDLEDIDWPERTKDGQRYWIGKSKGAILNFQVDGHTKSASAFTTRLDTIFGATFLVLSPEHSLLSEIVPDTHKQEVQRYIQAALRKTELHRQTDQTKTGVFTGCYGINPFTKSKIPIWVADYVLASYGTGAIMAVPAHDERDFEFAKKYKLEIIRVIKSEQPLPYEGKGKMVNSGFINDLDSAAAIDKLLIEIEKQKIGKVPYHL